MSLANDTAARLDSDLLRTFLAVAAGGSVTAGARTVLRSQSAVSLQIQRLEAVLGRPVFDRRGRGVVLTPFGATLVPTAERVVGLLDRTVAEAWSDGLTGTLRIGIPEEVGEAALSAIVATLSREHPGLDLAVRCGISSGFPEALARGELDAAIRDMESAGNADAVLRRVDRAWVGASASRPQERTPLPVALFDRACTWRDLAVQALDAAGIDYRIVYTSESVAGIMAAVRSGLAVALIGEVVPDRGVERVQDLPRVPPSLLVLSRRPGLDPLIGAAVERAVRTALGGEDGS